MQFSPQLPASLPDYLTVPQLARLLGVVPATIRDWSIRGILPEPIRLSPRLHLHKTGLVRKALARHFPELHQEQEEEGRTGGTDNQGGGEFSPQSGGDAPLAR